MKMRRSDRQMNKEFGLNIIDNSEYGILSMMDKDKDEAYSIPVSIIRIDNKLYFHSAKSGRKVDLIEKNKKVNLVFIGNTNIPDNYTKEELDNMVQDKTKIKNLISNVFTTEYKSCIVKGRINLLEDKKEKILAMKKICEKYTPDKMEYFDIAIQAGLSRTNIYSIEIDNIMSKRKKYNDSGVEIKGNI